MFQKVNVLAIILGVFSGFQILKAYADDADLVEYGKYLSGQCVTCHQLSGNNQGIPSIIGWDRDSFFEVMDLYRKKERENKIMRTITAGLSDEEIKALAAYFEKAAPE